MPPDDACPGVPHRARRIAGTAMLALLGAGGLAQAQKLDNWLVSSGSGYFMRDTPPAGQILYTPLFVPMQSGTLSMPWYVKELRLTVEVPRWSVGFPAIPTGDTYVPRKNVPFEVTGLLSAVEPSALGGAVADSKAFSLHGKATCYSSCGYQLVRTLQTGASELTMQVSKTMTGPGILTPFNFKMALDGLSSEGMAYNMDLVSYQLGYRYEYRADIEAKKLSHITKIFGVALQKNADEQLALGERVDSALEIGGNLFLAKELLASNQRQIDVARALLGKEIQFGAQAARQQQLLDNPTQDRFRDAMSEAFQFSADHILDIGQHLDKANSVMLALEAGNFLGKSVSRLLSAGGEWLANDPPDARFLSTDYGNALLQKQAGLNNAVASFKRKLQAYGVTDTGYLDLALDRSQLAVDILFAGTAFERYQGAMAAGKLDMAARHYALTKNEPGAEGGMPTLLDGFAQHAGEWADYAALHGGEALPMVSVDEVAMLRSLMQAALAEVLASGAQDDVLNEATIRDYLGLLDRIDGIRAQGLTLGDAIGPDVVGKALATAAVPEAPPLALVFAGAAVVALALRRRHQLTPSARPPHAADSHPQPAPGAAPK